MFTIKICGITTPDDARMVAQAGADAVGLNFYRNSKRYVTLDQAAEIDDELPGSVVRVGLFVNSPVEEVINTHYRIGLDLIQLHGDEPPEYLAELEGRPVMRAFRLGTEGLTPVDEYLEQCQALDCVPKLVLLDAHVAGHYGGTGQTADWEVAAQYPRESWHPPLVLAGGLTPKNVFDAIQAVGPTAVDTAGGVEDRPGQKDAILCGQFCRSARRAF